MRDSAAGDGGRESGPRAGAEGELGGAGVRRSPTSLWILAAVACVVAAAGFWWYGRAEAAFVAAALGVVSWFLNLRGDFKRKRDESEDAEVHGAGGDDGTEGGR